MNNTLFFNKLFKPNTIVIFLVLIIAASVFFRVWSISQKNMLSHDEAISYLAATGHQAEYHSTAKEKNPPFGEWVKAIEWKKFIKPEGRLRFGKISFDLAHYDIHPPLYFWLLHLWVLIFGVSLWAGPALNISLFLLTSLFLFQFARYLLKNSTEAGLVVFIWALSPATISTSSMARQYDLLALCTILFVWQIIRCTDLGKCFKWRDFFFLSLAGAAGMLTQYLFTVLVIPAGLVFLSIKLFKTNKKRLMKGVASIGVGAIFFLICHPMFYISFMRQRHLVQPFHFSDLLYRAKESSLLLFKYFGLNFSSLKWVFAVFTAVFILLTLTYFLSGLFRTCVHKKSSNEISAVYFFLWLYGGSVLLYLMFITPEHALRSRFLSIVWPFFAFIPVIFLRYIKKYNFLVTALFCACILICNIYICQIQKANNKEAAPLLIKNLPLSTMGPSKVVLDSVYRGFLLPRVCQLQDDQPLFAADQSFMINNQDLWLGQLYDNNVYIGSLSENNTKENQQKLLQLAKNNYEVAKISEDNLFKIQKKSKNTA